MLAVESWPPQVQIKWHHFGGKHLVALFEWKVLEVVLDLLLVKFIPFLLDFSVDFLPILTNFVVLVVQIIVLPILTQVLFVELSSLVLFRVKQILLLLH